MAAPAEAQKYIQLAKKLPKQLLSFFKQFPPNTPRPTTAASNAPESPHANNPFLAASPLTNPTYNPFLPWRNPVTGKWRPPMVSLRRQAELCKLARGHGVEELLPFSKKQSFVRDAVKEEGLKVRGTGVGQRVKGKAWERTLKGRLEKRRQAMLGMEKMVEQWEQRGHGRGWKKWPK
ncbi:hypothetical protein EJ06DRAFT_502624 [Trichodelitschia bisporula]|uniref:Large ribosomal subunit protein mL59 domain-containing protein n=1 Tax=Trichodelitschia bisporula TaxID=703511 RepID=A0A6G1IAT9_9PEZI|nr:hypothetical protein EJ06DRAFT_502624 [Trichodelitschia bisporula]